MIVAVPQGDVEATAEADLLKCPSRNPHKCSPALSVVGFASLALAGCGRGGTVALDLTDAPPDTANLEHVYVSLSAVEVHVVDKSEKKDGDPTDTTIDKDDKWREIVARAGTFDLLALQNDATARLGKLNLPDGKITQIRLHIDESGSNKAVLKGGEECSMDLSSVDKSGIKISHPFKALDVPEDATLRVVVDFDLKESVDQEGPCTFKLKPVIKIKTTEVLAAEVVDDKKSK
jgi:hypothetical protein